MIGIEFIIESLVDLVKKPDQPNSQKFKKLSLKNHELATTLQIICLQNTYIPEAPL